MRSLKTAYFLMLPTLLGMAGFHRFYMGKIGTGFLWLFTWGLFGVGTIYDAVTMARQLRDKDESDTGQIIDEREYWARLSDGMSDTYLRERIRHRAELDAGYVSDARSQSSAAGHQGHFNRNETLEHAALRIAKGSGGFTTPAQLALEANVTSDQAKKLLDELCGKGIADIRIRRNGVVAYVFPDFLGEAAAGDFESL